MAPPTRSVFAGLPKLTRAELALIDSLGAGLSRRPFAPDFVAGLEQVLAGLLRQPVALGRASIGRTRGPALCELLPDLACIAQIGLAPGEHKVLAELDPNLAAWMVERMLGGEGDQATGLLTPLTELERGVLSFAWLAVLDHFQQRDGTPAAAGLVLDHLWASPAELPEAWREGGAMAMVQVPVDTGRRQGGVRLILPEALLTAHFGPAPRDDDSADPRELERLRRQLGRLPMREVTAHVVVAQVELTGADIANVGVGDIIVLERHNLKKTARGLEGELSVRLGAGRHGGFSARLCPPSEGDRLALEVVQIMVQQEPPEPPAESAPTPTLVTEPPDNLAETQGLLREIEAPMVVELGRLRLNTAQVIRLKVGQVLRLGRGPSDPVDLVVDGKVFARGELIDVEGELGVRLTALPGSEPSA